MDKSINILIDDAYFYRWQGGKNYLINITKKMKREGMILHRLKHKNSPSVSDIVFDFEHEEKYPDQLSFDRIGWKLNRRVTWRKLNPWIEDIDVTFQVNNMDINKEVKSVRWIPDFQHVEMPELFDQSELNKRDNEFRNFAKEYDVILLSSYHAQNIFNELYPFAASKSRVYQFEVSIPNEVYSISKEFILKKYNLPEKYIHFPAQWWKHKNHRFIFEVMTQVTDDVHLVCTGKEEDYRNPEYANDLKQYLKENNLEKKVHCLGEIPYTDMLGIMRFSTIVINPSSYEGWSTTVEEAKLLEKYILCIDSPLFREQLSGASYDQFCNLDLKKWTNQLNQFFFEKSGDLKKYTSRNIIIESILI